MIRGKMTMVDGKEVEFGTHEFYKAIGHRGGRRGHTGGFASNPELARQAGRKGGKISKRGKAKNHCDMNSTMESTSTGVNAQK